MRFLYQYILLSTIPFFVSNSLAQQSSVNTDEASRIYSSWVFHNLDANYDSSMYYGDKYIKHQLKFGSTGDKIDAYNHKIRSLNQFNKIDQGFRLAHETYTKYCDESKGTKNCINCNSIYRQLANYMVTLRDYQEGINYLDKCCEKSPLDYYSKAKIYGLLEMPDKALALTSKSISIARKQDNPTKMIASYNQHGLIAKSLGRFDEAINSLTRAINIIDSIGLSRKKYGYIIGNLGSCYFEKGDLRQAYIYLQEDAKGSLENNYLDSYVNTQLLLAEVDILENNHQEAIEKLTTILDNYPNFLVIRNKVKAIRLLMQSHKSVGNDSKSDFYLQEWISLNKSYFQDRSEIHTKLTQENAANSLRQVTHEMDVEQQLLEQKLIAQEDKNRLKNWLAISGLCMALLVILFLISRARKKADLKETQLKLAQKEQDLLKLRMNEESRSVKLLSHELEEKQDFSSKLIKKLECIEGISISEQKSLELFIQNELDVKSTRAQLQKKMGILSSNFYINIKISHPNLTDLDLALASMVAMKMTNKEIGISKNLSQESVKTTKYRLKKKLNLTPDQDMESYLKNLF